MPRAGKTEQINRLSSFLNEKRIKHCIIKDREIDKEISIQLEAVFEYNLVFYNKILEKLISAKYSGDYDIVILDRGFLDGEAWFNLEHKQGKISKSEKEMANFYLENLRKYIDMGFLILIDPNLTVTRYKNKGEIGKKTYSLKDYRNYMKKLHQEYLRLKKKFRNDKKVVLLDGNKSIGDLHLKIKKKLQEKGII